MEKALAKWLEKGLIDKIQYLNLLEDLKKEKEKSQKAKVQITLYIIGAILLGFGVIVFIQANDWLIEFFQRNNFLKVALCSLLASGALYGGYKFSEENSKFPKLGVSLTFLSTLLIGGVWALLGQIYHIEANSFLITLLWFISVYPMAFVYNNNAINILSTVLYISTVYMFYYNCAIYDETSCLFATVGLIVGGVLYSFGNIGIIKEKFNNFSMTYKTTGLFFIFIMLFILTFVDDTKIKANECSLYMPLLAILGLNLFNYTKEKEKTGLVKAEAGFISFVVLLNLPLLYFSNIDNYIIGFFANALIILMIYLMYKYGFSLDNKRIVDLARKFLYLYLIINYFRIGSKYFHGAILLIVAGIILLYFGVRNEKMKRKDEKENN